IGPSWLWLPAAAMVTLLAFAITRRSLSCRDRFVVAVPVVAGVLLAVYVLRVGGDFMHARMWLPATFIALAPGLLVPVRRIALPALLLVVGWAAVIGPRLASRHVRSTSWYVEDERYGYVRWTKHPNPTSEKIYMRAIGPAVTMVADAARARRRAFISEDAVEYTLGDH